MAPVSLRDAHVFLPELTARDLIEAYSACGGYPLHLRSWDSESSTTENLRRLAGTPGGLLLEAAEHLIADLVHRSPGYGRVLRALGHDRLAHRELTGRSGQDVQQVLDVLEGARVIVREVPVGQSLATTKRRLYRISDPYLRFWFSVLGTEVEAVQGGRGHAVLRRAETRWRQHVAAVFEDACRDHAQRLVDAEQLPGTIVGRWWGTPRDAETRRAMETEIDVAALGDGATFELVGEVKWGDGDLRRILSGLDHKRRRVSPGAGLPMAVWTASRPRRRPPEIHLFDANDVMFG